MKHFLIFYLICFVFITGNYAEAKKSAGPAPLKKDQYKGEIIFVYLSRVCACAKRRGVIMKKSLQSILTNKKYNKIKLTQIDQSLKRKEAGDVLNKYKLFGIPCFFVLDKNGDLYYKQSSACNREKCIQALDDILAGRTRKKIKKEDKK